MVLDRAEERRTDQAELARLWADPSSVVARLSGEHMAVIVPAPTGEQGFEPGHIRYQSPTEVPDTALEQAYFLGYRPDGSAVFGLDVQPPERIQGAATLREVGALLDPIDREVFLTIQGLANWHRRHQRCSMCGEGTEVQRAGWVRKCPHDGSEHFPRTDPAVIVLVRDPDDRALLGRRAIWAPQWFSTLAGFVEPGESAEMAVVREVGEEASVIVDPSSIVGIGSQAWPFPSSLMLGFHATATSGADPTPDGDEIGEAQWFSRERLFELCSSGDVQIPSNVSIARRLIEAWYGSELPGEWSRP